MSYANANCILTNSRSDEIEQEEEEIKDQKGLIMSEYMIQVSFSRYIDEAVSSF